MSRITVAALQVGSHPLGKAQTLKSIIEYEAKIKSSGAKLVVLPEAILGGYPKGQIFGTFLGYRLPEGRETFRLFRECY